MQSPRPLAGLRVLEFSHTIMGPCAGLLLADLGADVIKVEPVEGDNTRRLNGFAAGFFATFNRNKRSIAIDLKQPDGQAVVHRLVKDADIVLENYGPGTMEKLGCGWAQLQPLNERLIYLALKGYLAGPLQNRPALDEVVQFQSGLAYMTGPVGQPIRAGASIVDILGAVFGVTAALAALRERDNTGKGQRIGSALFESAAFLMASHIAGGATTGQSVPPMTARKGAWGIYDVFHAKDGTPVFIGVTSDAQWQRFCEEFGYGDWFADARLTTNPQRTSEREWLIPALRERLSTLDHDALLASLKAADVSWSPVGRPEDLTDNEQLLEQGVIDTALATASQSVADAVRLPGLPLEFGVERVRTRLERQPPTLGEHSTDVLLEAGFDRSRIRTLHDQGVITIGE